MVGNLHFTVTNANGGQLTGREKIKQIVRALVKLPLAQQPADFQAIVGLLKAKLQGSNR